MGWDYAAIAPFASTPTLLQSPSDLPAGVALPAGAPSPFARLIEREIGDLNHAANAAEAGMRDLAAGKPVELHEVMINLERARTSVQAFVQVRNKLVEAYQDLMRMQL